MARTMSNNRGPSAAKASDSANKTAMMKQIKDDTKGFNQGAFTKGLPNPMATARDYGKGKLTKLKG